MVGRASNKQWIVATLNLTNHDKYIRHGVQYPRCMIGRALFRRKVALVPSWHEITPPRFSLHKLIRCSRIDLLVQIEHFETSLLAKTNRTMIEANRTKSRVSRVKNIKIYNRDDNKIIINVVVKTWISFYFGTFNICTLTSRNAENMQCRNLTYTTIWKGLIIIKTIMAYLRQSSPRRNAIVQSTSRSWRSHRFPRRKDD